MKLTSYPAHTTLAGEDLLVVRGSGQRTLRKITALNVAAYLLAPSTPAYLLAASSDRLLLETGERLRVESGADTRVENLDEAVLAFIDLFPVVQALTGQTKSVRLAELGAYLTTSATVAAHLLTEAGDTLVSEANEAIQVE